MRDPGEVQLGDNLWDIVGVPPGSTRDEIRKAYRQKARKLHPDLCDEEDASARFRRLVNAFELLMDEQKRAEFDASRIKNSAAQRARRAWDDVERSASQRAWGPDAASPSDRPAGSRREAEARARDESNARRRRWREMLFTQVWRDHMPLEFAVGEEARPGFVARMEALVDEYTTRPSEATGAGEASETEMLREVRVREVVEAELQDARHRSLKHRERITWLEAQLAQAENKAAMWKGAAPSSEADRVQAMERELAFLELGARLRERLDEQRTAIGLLRRREAMLLERLATWRRD
jgi:curved DNA-binding protein CbpA